MPDRQPITETIDWVRTLYWGPNGAGKSFDCAHVTKLGPAVWYNAEGGVKLRPLQRAGIDTSRILQGIMRAEDFTYQNLLNEHKSLLLDLQDNPGCYAGLVWDNLTSMSENLLDEVRQIEYPKAVANAEKANRPIPHPMFTDQGYYLIMGNELTKLIRRFVDLPCHLAVTAMDRDDPGKKGPSIIPSMQSPLVGYMDCVIQLERTELKGEEFYLGWTRPLPAVVRRDRLEALPNPMVNPTFDRVVDYVHNKITEEEDEFQQHYYEVAEARRMERAASRPKAKPRINIGR